MYGENTAEMPLSQFVLRFIERQESEADHNGVDMYYEEEDDKVVPRNPKEMYRQGAHDIIKHLAIDRLLRENAPSFKAQYEDAYSKAYLYNFFMVSMSSVYEVAKQWRAWCEDAQKKYQEVTENFHKTRTQRDVLDIEVRALRDENARLTERVKFLEAQGGAHQQGTDELHEKYKKLKSVVEKGLGSVLDSFTNILTEIK